MALGLDDLAFDAAPGREPVGGDVSLAGAAAPARDADATRSTGDTGERGRAAPRSRQHVDRQRRGNGRAGAPDGPGEPSAGAGWLTEVQAQLEQADGLTDGKLPLTLAQAIVKRNMPPLDLVQALEKCENMALKLKAAKFLKDTGKVSIEEMRAYAKSLMMDDKEGTNGEA